MTTAGAVRREWLLVAVPAVWLGLLLAWGAAHFDWVGMRSMRLQRIGLLAVMVGGAAVLYFGALAAMGLRLRSFIKR